MTGDLDARGLRDVVGDLERPFALRRRRLLLADGEDGVFARGSS